MRSPDFDTDLAVGTVECSGQAALSDHGGGGGTDSAISFTGDGRPWFIRANSLGANVTGAYSVEVVEIQPHAALFSGRILQADLARSDPKLPDNSFYDCLSVETAKGVGYRVTMRSQAFDTYLSAGTAQCSGSPALYDDGGGGTDSLLFFTGDGQVWFVRANSLEADAVGAYSVELTEGGRASAEATVSRVQRICRHREARPGWPSCGARAVGQRCDPDRAVCQETSGPKRETSY